MREIRFGSWNQHARFGPENNHKFRRFPMGRQKNYAWNQLEKRVRGKFFSGQRVNSDGDECLKLHV